MIRFKKLLVLIFLFTANIVGASYLDDWPDDALCGWMQQPSPPEHIVQEVKKRGILCTDGIASIDPNASTDQSSGGHGRVLHDGRRYEPAAVLRKSRSYTPLPPSALCFVSWVCVCGCAWCRVCMPHGFSIATTMGQARRDPPDLDMVGYHPIPTPRGPGEER